LAATESGKEPETQGTLDTTTGKVKILPTLKSDIKLWAGVPKKYRGPYTLFCDLGQGVGAAFSVAEVVDSGGEQVLEYGTNTLDITAFAHNVVLLARWLAGDEGDGAVLIDFEGGGGQQAKPFAAELERMGYGNIHRSDVKHVLTRVGEVSRYFGTCNRDGGMANFRELERAIMAMDCVVRSAQIPNEMRLFGRDQDTGQPTYPIGRRDGHGDYMQALAGAWWRARTMSSPENRVQLENATKRATSRPQADPWGVTRELWSNNWVN